MAKEASLMPKRVETSFGTKAESNWFLQLGKSISDSMRTFGHSFTKRALCPGSLPSEIPGMNQLCEFQSTL